MSLLKTSLNLNSLIVTAGSTDLYFCLLPEKNQIAPLSADEYDFTDSFVYFVEAETSMTFSGLAVGGVKINNNSGAEYYIMGMSY